MTGVLGMHSVIYDATGVPLEVRVLPYRQGRKVGPYKLREDWCTYGRLTWSIPEPITNSARCVMNSASRQIQDRNKLRAQAAANPRKPIMADTSTTVHGYPTEEPCEVCSAVDGNAIEPRFAYSSCRTHRSVPPAHLAQAKEQFAKSGHTQWDAVDPGAGNIKQ